jgi:hypothetical protein
VRATRAVIVCLLLAVVPMSGLRMVCITAHGLVGELSGSADAASAAADAECERTCRRHPAADAPRQQPPPAVQCLLLADPSCELLAGAAPALLPAVPASRPAVGAAAFVARGVPRYLPPSPARHTPPPEPLA